MSDYIIKPKIDLRKGTFEQSSPVTEEFKKHLESIGINVFGFDFYENPYYANIGLYLCPNQTFDLAYRIMFQSYVGLRDKYENSEEDLLAAEKTAKQRLKNITKTFISLLDKYNIPHKYIAAEDYETMLFDNESILIETPNLSFSMRSLKYDCLLALYKDNMKIVLNELCKAEIKPSFFICHDTSYIIGFYETLLPLPKTYQDKISCIINSVLKQADRTGFYSNEDVAVYYKSVIDYGISHDIEESYIIKLPYRTIDGTLVNEEFLGDGLLHI